MAAIGIKGTVTQSKQQFTMLNLVGTETINATLSAGEIAIVIDTGVNEQNSAVTQNTVNRLMDALREVGFVVV